MSDNELRALLKKEKRIRNSMDTVFQFTKESKEKVDYNEVQVRLQLLDTAFINFNSVREKIELMMDEIDEQLKMSESELDSVRDNKLEAVRQKREGENAAVASEVENYYCQIKAVLLSMQTNDQKSANSISVSMPSSAPPKVKLPEIKLPMFNGKLRDWIPYRDAFYSLIHTNANLSDMDKFTYLRSSLTEDALFEIGSIELVSANYEVAWKMLQNRYHNKKLIVKDYLDAIFSTDVMKKEGFESLNRVISSFDKNLLMLQKMGENTEGWSTLLVHMVCSKLDPVTLRLWETYHNSMDIPTYAKLMQFLKNHCSVLQSVGPSKAGLDESR